MILLIDNYDSFVHNLARYFRRWGQHTMVTRNDAIDARGVRRLGAEAVVISPGPCTPREAGASLEIISELAGEIPLLGVCLGHQAIAQALGGVISCSPEPRHGRCSEIFHDGAEEFTGIANPFVAGRYHSLVVDPHPARLPSDLQVSARSADGLIMGLRHREWPVFGWQFHPESILTSSGFALIGGFLRSAHVAHTLPEAGEGTGQPATTLCSVGATPSNSPGAAQLLHSASALTPRRRPINSSRESARYPATF